MESYYNTWDQRAICGILMNNFQLEDGKIVLQVRVKNDNNYRESDGGWHSYHISPQDFHGFLAGLSVNPTDIDGSCDDELQIKLDDGKLLLLDDHLEGLHKPYVMWTESEDYDNDEFGDIVTIIEEQGRKIPVNDELFKTLNEQSYVLAMRTNGGIAAIFKRHVPLSFIRGLEAFETISRDYSIYITKLPDE